MALGDPERHSCGSRSILDSACRQEDARPSAPREWEIVSRPITRGGKEASPTASLREKPDARWIRVAAVWLLTALLTVVAFYGVVVPSIGWLDGAYNQAQGGEGYIVAVIFDVAMALITPSVFVFVWNRRKRRDKPVVRRYWAACGYTSLVGIPMLLLRLLAGAGF